MNDDKLSKAFLLDKATIYNVLYKNGVERSFKTRRIAHRIANAMYGNPEWRYNDLQRRRVFLTVYKELEFLPYTKKWSTKLFEIADKILN